MSFFGSRFLVGVWLSAGLAILWLLRSRCSSSLTPIQPHRSPGAALSSSHSFPIHPDARPATCLALHHHRLIFPHSSPLPLPIYPPRPLSSPLPRFPHRGSLTPPTPRLANPHPQERRPPLQVHLQRALLRVHREEVPGGGGCVCLPCFSLFCYSVIPPLFSFRATSHSFRALSSCPSPAPFPAHCPKPKRFI